MSPGGDLATAVQAWVDVSWDQTLTIREWWHRLADAGYAYPAWPVGVGGSGMSSADTRVVMGILARNGVVGPPVGHVAANLAAPTLLKHGTDDQIAEHVRSIA
ncbi:MAG TPA: acyl-CoA dehydrogenase family protein, partial [Galbitalea sp.]|nr:acyl-CoA dehydrogenase family protein [Galbitalea sp.]